MTTLSPAMTLIAGPCVIESRELVMEIATELKRALQGLDVSFYFKASFDKANRSAIDGFRGPGLEQGLKILSEVKSQLGLKVLTDVHSIEQVAPVAEVVDYIQIPAFLCRQTDLIVAAAEQALQRGCRLNIKKGQFLAPWDVKNIRDKVQSVHQRFLQKQPGLQRKKDWFTITERGTSFGYNALVVDMSGIQIMQNLGMTVIYDATHSVQVPGAGPGGKSTGGKRQVLETLARSAMAAGADGLFMECHPRPDEAKSDAANAFHLKHVGDFVRQLLVIRATVAEMPRLLPEAQRGI